MSEELEKVVEEGLEQKQAPEYTEAEQQAIEKGWNPDKSKLPEGKEFVSAEEYLKRESFFNKIDAQKKRIEQLENTVGQINEHHRKSRERELQQIKREYEQTIRTLQSEKIKALDEGDSQRVVEIDEQIRQTPVPQQDTSYENNIIEDWKKANPWYDNDEFLGTEADLLASQYASRKIPLSDALVKIENHLKSKYPDKFEDKRQQPPTVEGGSPPKPPSNKNVTVKDLTPDEKTIFQDMERFGAFKTDADKKKYLKEVINLRD